MSVVNKCLLFPLIVSVCVFAALGILETTLKQKDIRSCSCCPKTGGIVHPVCKLITHRVEVLAIYCQFCAKRGARGYLCKASTPSTKTVIDLYIVN